MRTKQIVGAVCIGLFCVSVSAQEMPPGMKNPATVEGLAQACQSMLNSLSQTEIYDTGMTDDVGTGVQIGYCMGYMSAYRALAKSIKSASVIQLACIPNDVHEKALAKALVDAFEADPKWGARNADGFVFAVFEAKWPCPKGEKQ